MNMEPGLPLPPPAPIDPLLQARLDRLAAKRVDTAVPSATGCTTPSTGRSRRRHAAKRSRAAAVLMSVGATAGLSAYFHQADAAGASNATSSGAAVAVAVTPATVTTGAASAAGSTPTAAATSPTAAATAASTTVANTTGSTSVANTTGSTSAAAQATATSALADGTYAGATATNKWGPVQVQITVANGQISNVVALQTPTADRKSVSINQRATPTLASEVLSAQSASIDAVSGATYTSDGYKTSLQSAIDLARSTAVQSSAGS